MHSIFTRLARPLAVLALVFSTATLQACVAHVHRRPARAGVVVAPRRTVVRVHAGGHHHGHGHHGHHGHHGRGRGRGHGPR